MHAKPNVFCNLRMALTSILDSYVKTKLPYYHYLDNPSTN